MPHVAKRRRLDSPDSSDRQASASRWFDRLNDNNRQEAVDGPPYYLNATPPGAVPAHSSTDSSFGGAPIRHREDDSENEDLRSVIDDLTIENKRLRQKLCRRRHRCQLGRDKIFELTTCGLPSDKRRELEVILQDFASSITDIGSMRPQKALLVEAGACQPGIFNSHPDSAYASLSNSGMTSTGKFNNCDGPIHRAIGTNNQRVISRLHGVPDVLLPKHSPVMSENSKMRLVVQRLEQLFTGSDAAAGGHNQPAQQQMIAESAANSERQDLLSLHTRLRPEGTREASILPFGSNLDLDPLQAGICSTADPKSRHESEGSIVTRSVSGNRSRDQRPTRPLDLDIHRAQRAEDNIEYIRHLGLPTPTLERNPDDASDGWLYLNLLINMAQLHTANVTPAFIRKSIAHVSTKFELSQDGQKIRWKGDLTYAGLKSTRDNGIHVTTAKSAEMGQGCSKSNCEAASANPENRAAMPSSQNMAGHPSSDLTSEVAAPACLTASRTPERESTGQATKTSSLDHKNIPCKQRVLLADGVSDGRGKLMTTNDCDHFTRRDTDFSSSDSSRGDAESVEQDGPMIFYRHSIFYCDMSGDKAIDRSKIGTSCPISQPVLGVVRLENGPEPELPGQRFRDSEAFDEYDLDTEALPRLEVDPLSREVMCTASPVDLAVSGIGGVVPDDHFVVEVQRRHCSLSTDRILSTCLRKAQTDLIQEEILASTHVQLRASELPPASYVPVSHSSQRLSQIEGDEITSPDFDDTEEDSVDAFRPTPHSSTTVASSTNRCLGTTWEQ